MTLRSASATRDPGGDETLGPLDVLRDLLGPEAGAIAGQQIAVCGGSSA